MIKEKTKNVCQKSWESSDGKAHGCIILTKTPESKLILTQPKHL